MQLQDFTYHLWVDVSFKLDTSVTWTSAVNDDDNVANWSQHVQPQKPDHTRQVQTVVHQITADILRKSDQLNSGFLQSSLDLAVKEKNLEFGVY